MKLRCLLYSLVLCFFGRAQKRTAQQRIDSKMDLGRVVDIRKKVFTEVKVRPFIFYLLRPHQVLAPCRNSPTLVHKSVMSGQYLKYGLHQIMKFSPLEAGQEQLNCGTFLLVHQYVHCEVRISLYKIIRFSSFLQDIAIGSAALLGTHRRR